MDHAKGMYDTRSDGDVTDRGGVQRADQRAQHGSCRQPSRGAGGVGLGEARGVQGFAPSAPGSRHTRRGKDALATLVVFREGTGVDGARGRGTLHTSAVCHGRALQQALCPYARHATPLQLTFRSLA